MGTCLGLLGAILLIIVDPRAVHSVVYGPRAPFSPFGFALFMMLAFGAGATVTGLAFMVIDRMRTTR
jgi:hypothetical protein